MKKAAILKMINEDPYEARFKLINCISDNNLFKRYEREYELPEAPTSSDFKAQTIFALSTMVLLGRTRDFKKISFEEALELKDFENGLMKKIFIEDYDPEVINNIGVNKTKEDVISLCLFKKFTKL